MMNNVYNTLMVGKDLESCVLISVCEGEDLRERGRERGGCSTVCSCNAKYFQTSTSGGCCLMWSTFVVIMKWCGSCSSSVLAVLLAMEEDL